MTETVLRLENVNKKFGQLVVADSLDLVVRDGEALGIVGPNGAGKSTLFAMISGELRVDGGTIELEGDDLTRLPSHARTRMGIGRTFQVPRPFEGMTVFENILVFAVTGAGLHGNSATSHALEVAERTGLGALLNSRAGALGLLHRKRLEVARALATKPRVLLLDEVAGGLTDPEVTELVELIRRINGEGTTVVWIEHVVHALTALVTRLACLAGGRMIADGNPHDVLEDPVVREVYLGTTIVTEEDVQ